MRLVRINLLEGVMWVFFAAIREYLSRFFEKKRMMIMVHAVEIVFAAFMLFLICAKMHDAIDKLSIR